LGVLKIWGGKTGKTPETGARRGVDSCWEFRRGKRKTGGRRGANKKKGKGKEERTQTRRHTTETQHSRAEKKVDQKRKKARVTREKGLVKNRKGKVKKPKR